MKPFGALLTKLAAPRPVTWSARIEWASFQAGYVIEADDAEEFASDVLDFATRFGFTVAAVSIASPP